MEFDGGNQIHYPLPEGAEEWQTPEWSTHPNFDTGSIMNDEFIYDIVLVNLAEKGYLQVTTDGGYVHAHLWVG